MDTLLWFGGEVKALDDNGRVGGYLVRFSDSDHKDLVGDYFTKDTYYGPKFGDGSETLFEHGFPVYDGADLPDAVKSAFEELADHTFAPIKTKKDTIGIWAETVLNIADEYEKAVFGIVKKGKLGWSSGAPGHRVKRQNDGRITSWPIAEGSLTPRPAEPLNRAIAFKSLASVKFIPIDDADVADPAPATPSLLAIKLNQHIDDLVDDGLTREHLIERMAKEAGVKVDEITATLEGKTTPTKARLKAYARALNISYDVLKASARRDYSQTVKGMYEDALSERTPSRWEMESAYCDIVSKMLAAALAARIAGIDFDWEAKVKEATREYAAMLEDHALSQGRAYLDSGSDEPFYLKAIIDLQNDLPVSGSLDLDDHSQLVVSALREVAKRFRGNHEARVKSGRILSEKNRRRISDGLKDIQAVVEDLTALLDESQPMATDTEKRAAHTTFLRLQARIKPLGVTDGKETARAGN
jgi:transcriptional regulator with XRE-family HTH domain